MISLDNWRLWTSPKDLRYREPGPQQCGPWDSLLSTQPKLPQKDNRSSGEYYSHHLGNPQYCSIAVRREIFSKTTDKSSMDRRSSIPWWNNPHPREVLEYIIEHMLLWFFRPLRGGEWIEGCYVCPFSRNFIWTVLIFPVLGIPRRNTPFTLSL